VISEKIKMKKKNYLNDGCMMAKGRTAFGQVN